jgi:hypothetical protein
MPLVRKHGKVVWNEVDFPMFEEVGSTGTFVLSRHQGAAWMRDVPTVTGAWLENFGGEALASTSLLSTGSVRGSLLLERTVPTAPSESRHRYYRYLLANVADGRIFQAGPDKDVADGHHRAGRPAHLAELYSRSTSTGW